MISINHVYKSFRAFRALNDVSLELPDKGLVSLTGENGCGKTTLLNLIAAVDYPDSGSIQYDNHLYNRKNYPLLHSDVISYVQQENAFIDYLTVSDNLQLFGGDRQENIETLQAFNVAEKFLAFPRELSGGQRQKVSFIRGVTRHTPVLLVDEPTSNMDEASEAATFKLLKSISAHCLVVVVSHNRYLIKQYSDLIVSMNDGRIESVEKSDSLLPIAIDGDTVTIPDGVAYDINRDWVVIKAVLREYRHVLLQLGSYENSQKDEGCQKETTRADSSIARTKEIPKISTLSAKSAVKSLTAQPLRQIIGVVLCTLWLLILCAVICLNAVDPVLFEYDMFTGNGYSDVFYTMDTVYDEKSQIPFTAESYASIRNLYGQGGILYFHTDNYEIDIGLPDNSDYRYPYLLTYGIVDETSDVFTFAVGGMPGTGSVIISDYIADQYITAGIFQTYQDILDNEIHISGYPMKVSGVFQTDYKKYPHLYSDVFPDIDIQDRSWYQTRFQYCAAFTDNTAFLDYLDTGLTGAIMNYGQLMADVRILPDSFRGESGIYTNFQLEDGFMPYFKSDYFYGDYIGVLPDTDTDVPTVFITKDVYQTALSGFDNNLPFYGIMYRLTSPELVETLDLHYMSHDTPLSNSVREAENMVMVIHDGFAVITCIMFVVLLMLFIFVWLNEMAKHKFTQYSLITTGAHYGNIVCFNFIRAITKVLLECILSCLLFAPLAGLMNAKLSDILNVSVVLIQPLYRYILMACGIYLCGVSMFILAYSLAIYLQRPVKLYCEVVN